MKNVMVRAWKIAREAVAKFGGKVREYFSQALAMAWKEVKAIREKHFGFTEIRKVNGLLHFAVTNVEVLNVSVVGSKTRFDYKALRNEKVETKTLITEFRTGVEKATGRAVRIYTVSIDRMKLEFRAGESMETLCIERGLLTWS
ncbi:hypothetical protein [Paenibacillus sp. S150]|uniref:hypothetical protein n=1 Tax=Paenibacillus sp. S150 TaxID=2749826 RepID=UPI001C560AC6|nr:hypothetical protein [Paenibacillus sp. S150]MBW4083552.1 hypothetical protein [Paenibacillus sp. S150]